MSNIPVRPLPHSHISAHATADCSSVKLGFGVTAKSTQECRKLDPTAICVFHQADVGEYLRDEDTAQAIG